MNGILELMHDFTSNVAFLLEMSICAILNTSICGTPNMYISVQDLKGHYSHLH